MEYTSEQVRYLQEKFLKDIKDIPYLLIGTKQPDQRNGIAKIHLKVAMDKVKKLRLAVASCKDVLDLFDKGNAEDSVRYLDSDPELVDCLKELRLYRNIRNNLIKRYLNSD